MKAVVESTFTSLSGRYARCEYSPKRDGLTDAFILPNDDGLLKVGDVLDVGGSLNILSLNGQPEPERIFPTLDERTVQILEAKRTRSKTHLLLEKRNH